MGEGSSSELRKRIRSSNGNEGGKYPRQRQQRIVLGDGVLKIRLESRNKETLTQGLARLVELLGAENLGDFRTPDGPGRYDDWLLYFKWNLDGPFEEVVEVDAVASHSDNVDDDSTAGSNENVNKYVDIDDYQF